MIKSGCDYSCRYRSAPLINTPTMAIYGGERVPTKTSNPLLPCCAIFPKERR